MTHDFFFLTAWLRIWHMALSIHPHPPFSWFSDCIEILFLIVVSVALVMWPHLTERTLSPYINADPTLSQKNLGIKLFSTHYIKHLPLLKVTRILFLFKYCKIRIHQNLAPKMHSIIICWLIRKKCWLIKGIIPFIFPSWFSKKNCDIQHKSYYREYAKFRST